MRVEISTGFDEQGGLVAFAQGATFTKDEMRTMQPWLLRDYVIGFSDGNEPIEIHAKDDASAVEFAKAQYNGPFTLLERIVEFREVAEV